MDTIVNTVAVILVISLFGRLEASPTGELNADIDMTEVFEACMKEHNINESLFFKIITSGGEIPETEDVKCFLSCIMINMGYMSDEGVIDWSKHDENDKAGNSDPEELDRVSEISEICNKKVPKDLGNKCDTAFAAMKCYFEEFQKQNVSVTELTTK